MPSGEDRTGRTIVSFLAGITLCVVIAAFAWPDVDELRTELREEVHAEYMAEKTLLENEIALENLVWAIKRIDGELEDLWDRVEIADLLDKQRADFAEDLNNE